MNEWMNVMLVFLAILDLNSHGHYELSLYGEYLCDETEKKGKKKKNFLLSK